MRCSGSSTTLTSSYRDRPREASGRRSLATRHCGTCQEWNPASPVIARASESQTRTRFLPPIRRNCLHIRCACYAVSTPEPERHAQLVGVESRRRQQRNRSLGRPVLPLLPTRPQDRLTRVSRSLSRIAARRSRRACPVTGVADALVADDRRPWNASCMSSLPATFAEDVIDQPVRA